MAQKCDFVFSLHCTQSQQGSLGLNIKNKKKNLPSPKTVKINDQHSVKNSKRGEWNPEIICAFSSQILGWGEAWDNSLNWAGNPRNALSTSQNSLKYHLKHQVWQKPRNTYGMTPTKTTQRRWQITASFLFHYFTVTPRRKIPFPGAWWRLEPKPSVKAPG